MNEQNKLDGLIEIILASYISNTNPLTKWGLLSIKFIKTIKCNKRLAQKGKNYKVFAKLLGKKIKITTFFKRHVSIILQSLSN